MKSQFYQGNGPEIVWVGPGAEVCALGTEMDKYRFLKTGRFDVISMGLRMGFLAPRLDAQGNPEAVVVTHHPDADGNLLADPAGPTILLSQEKEIAALGQRFENYLLEHTGVRSIAARDTDWLPADFLVQRDLKVKLPEKMVALLQSLGLTCEIGREVTGADADRVRESARSLQVPAEMLAGGRVVETNFPAVLRDRFPFKVDLGAPLPTAWQESPIGFSKKEVLGMNAPLVMAHEVIYRALLQACLHPLQTDLYQFFPADKVGLYFGSGIGPHAEHQQMVADTIYGVSCGAKALANCIANIACGYISGRLGIKGKISTHVGACETGLGSIADAYHDLKAGRMHAALAGGFDDAMTASSYNGFTSNQAFTTNEKTFENVAALLEEGAIDDPAARRAIEARRSKIADLEGSMKRLEEDFSAGRIDYYTMVRRERELKGEKTRAYLRLPKCISRYASMPFSKYRSGFVMGVGGGAGFFTTLERAVALGLPIRALVAACAEMVPDTSENGSSSIAALGDGVGDAYDRAFLEARANYRAAKGGELGIEEIGVWFAHGTSTPLNGWGERREIERVHRKYGRPSNAPILITGDKAESGHRVAGNFPSLIGYLFETQEVLPVGNYNQAGFAPKGRRGFGEPLDELFPSSRVVGKAGVGGGKPVPYAGDFVAVNGAGFGRINTVLLFRKFKPEEMPGSEPAVREYPEKLRKNLATREKLAAQILFGAKSLISAEPESEE